MFTFTVNGQTISTEKDEKLLVFLRETLGLTSVKNGCAEGACGTCTILIDGKATKACVFKTSKCTGKHIITCEGLSDRERPYMPMPIPTVVRSNAGSARPGWL